MPKQVNTATQIMNGAAQVASDSEAKRGAPAAPNFCAHCGKPSGKEAAPGLLESDLEASIKRLKASGEHD